MATQWFYQDAGEERGPVAFRELIELVRAGTVTETDLVRSSWKAEWQRAYSVVGLFHMAGRSPAELAEASPPPMESLAAEAPADMAALDADDVTERPGWMTRLSSVSGPQNQNMMEIPNDGTSVSEDSAVSSAGDAGQSPAATVNSTGDLSPELAGYYSKPTSSPGSDAWSSAVDEALARADQKTAGSNPPVGRWARLAKCIANPLAAMRDMGRSRWIRPAFRLACAIVCANLVAWAVEEWSAAEEIRYPAREITRGRDAGGRHFPFVGKCGSGEYMFLVFDLMLVTGAAGYFAARWLDSRAE